jgi:O-antigen ligase
MLFYAFMMGWPLFTRKKQLYYLVFWGFIIFMLAAIASYLFLTMFGGLEALNELSLKLFKKSMWTRTGIWSLLCGYIAEQPFFGYGTESASTLIVAPDWAPQRKTINSHSLYFELLLRFGVVGLLLFIILMFSIWKTLWIGRREKAVRVAGSFLLAALFFSSTVEFLIFNMQLRNGFAWIIFGIGMGASLRARKIMKRKSLIEQTSQAQCKRI